MRVLLLLAGVLSITSTDKLSTSSFKNDSTPSFLLKVIQHTLSLSKRSSIHIFNHDAQHSPSQLIYMLHEHHIHTTVGSIPDLETQQSPKNLLFLLCDCGDIFELIANSTKNRKNLSIENHLLITPNHQDLKIGLSDSNFTKSWTNEAKMKGIISDSNYADFQENSILPPKSLEGRLLYHPVWNGENYLIFNIWNAGSAEQFCANNPPPPKNIERALMPTFKSIWQFFRGLKTIICIGDHCFGYDPFTETITSFSAKNESFFDYSMSDIRGKQISNLVYDSRDPCDYYCGLKHWDEFQHFLMETVVEHMNGALYQECCRVEGDRDECLLDFSGRIEKDDVVTFEARLEDDDFRHLDVVSMYDFGKLYFIVPDKGLRFDPPHTTEDLRKSDILFQMNKAPSKLFRFMDDPMYDWMESRFIHSWYDYRLGRDDFWVMLGHNNTDDTVYYDSLLGLNLSELALKSMLKAERSIFHNDGFVAFLPNLASKKELFKVPDMGSLRSIGYDYHIVRECIMSYPYDMRLLSGSVYAANKDQVGGRAVKRGRNNHEGLCESFGG
ncbi:unnamed protein product [Bemisia tabaci]|uniref:Uncharacterized protein n=1 Tax=Bemisia tabaci TaxID=7038 RepID=A0A9P0AG30_BEMTA|nr:unnamed protein product [Bemisia tabaci]